MPLAVGKIPNPNYGRMSGFLGGRPLTERFSETLSWALTQIPQGQPERDGLPSLMLTELNIDAIHEAVERYKQRTAKPVDEALQGAWNELLRLQRAINEGVTQLHEVQKRWLWHAQHDWEHALLKSLRADMTTPIEREDLEWPTERYPDVPSTKAAIREKRVKLDRIQDLSSLISNAQAYDELPVEQSRSYHLCHGLFDEQKELKNRLIAVESQNAANEARINQLEAQLRKANPKRKAA